MTAPPGVAPGLRGQGLRDRFLVILAIAGVIPLLVALYLALPLVRPRVMASGLYPQDPLLFWVILFFLSTLELIGLYLGLDLVRSVTRLTEAVTVESGLESGAPAAGGGRDEVSALGRAFSSLVATTRRQGEDLEAYGARIEHLEAALRVASRQLRDADLNDDPTGLGNARLLRLRLDDEVRRAGRLGTSVTLVRLTVNGVGSQPGAGPGSGVPAGGLALQQVAGALRGACRDADLACRLGGDHFAVLLPQGGSKAGAVVAERVCRAVEEALGTAGVEAAVTCAVASLPDEGLTATDLWRAAGLPAPEVADDTAGRQEAAPAREGARPAS